MRLCKFAILFLLPLAAACGQGFVESTADLPSDVPVEITGTIRGYLQLHKLSAAAAKLLSTDEVLPGIVGATVCVADVEDCCDDTDDTGFFEIVGVPLGAHEVVATYTHSSGERYEMHVAVTVTEGGPVELGRREMARMHVDNDSTEEEEEAPQLSDDQADVEKDAGDTTGAQNNEDTGDDPLPGTIPPSSPDAFLRAVHIGGDWGDNHETVHTLPDEFFEYLRNLDVNWVGFNIALSYEDSVDPTVDRRYDADIDMDAYGRHVINTIDDETLRTLIRAFRDRGFHFYITLAFDDCNLDAVPGKIAQRWQLGDPFAVAETNDPTILAAENWPWALTHPDHDAFVTSFFASLTEQAVHFATIAEEESVELFSFGGETERLFRTRAVGVWPNHFRSEIQAMVDAIKAVYSGRLTYDMHYGALTSDYTSGRYIWQDIDGLDVIGVSAYFPLYTNPPAEVPTTEELIARWEAVFDDFIEPLHVENPEFPIVFTEMGYVDHTGASANPSAHFFEPKEMLDADGDGLRDAEEEQANIYDAFFAVASQRDYMRGAFLWDNWITTQEQWDLFFGTVTTMSVRGKLAHDVVAEWYADIAAGE